MNNARCTLWPVTERSPVVSRLEKALSEITYKPCHKIKFHTDVRQKASFLMLNATVPNADHPRSETMIHLTVDFCLKRFESEGAIYLMSSVKLLIHIYEDHEQMEWLKVNGVKVDNPHA